MRNELIGTIGAALFEKMSAVFVSAQASNGEVSIGWDDIAKAVLAAQEAAGFAVVPVEPTLEMLDAGHEAARKVYVMGAGGMTIDAQTRRECAREYAAYRAMLKAAKDDANG